MAAGTKKAEIEAWFALRFPEETTNMGTKEELEKMKTMRRLLKAQIDAYVKRAGGGNEDSVADVVGTTRLLRFLRSVDGDVKEATKRFSEFLDWREKDEIKPDDVRAEVKDIPLEKFREFVQSQPTEKYCRRALFAGQNFRGDLLSCTIRGGVYPRAMSAIAGENFKDKAYHGFVRYMEWVSHWLHKESVKRGRLVYCCRIWDEGGLSLRHMYGDGIDTIKRASKYGAAMYPNTLGALLIVNPPTVLRVFWNLLAPLFDPRTLAKVRVLASTEDEATQAWIVALFGKENVPPEWGGTHAGGGTLTNAFPAPEVDPDELKKLCSTDVVSDRSGSLYVKAGKTGAVELSIEKEDVGSEITWNVEVGGGYDVDFFVRLVELDSGEVTFPREAARLQGRASGTITPKGTGSLRFEFGNSYSWLRGKTVEYDITFGSGGKGAAAAAAAAAAAK